MERDVFDARLATLTDLFKQFTIAMLELEVLVIFDFDTAHPALSIWDVAYAFNVLSGDTMHVFTALQNRVQQRVMLKVGMGIRSKILITPSWLKGIDWNDIAYM